MKPSAFSLERSLLRITAMSVPKKLSRIASAVAFLSLLAFVSWWAFVTPERVASMLMTPGFSGDTGRAATDEMSNEPFTVETSDGVSIRAWFIPAVEPAQETVVICHGVGADHWGALGLARTMRDAGGLNVVVFDFRGHGLSESALYTYGGHETQDLEAVVDWTRDRTGGRQISLVAWSAGAAIALLYAATDPHLQAVVAINSFADMSEMAEYRRPFFVRPSVYRAALQRVQSQANFRIADVSPLQRAGSIAVPVLLIVGAADATIPPTHSRRLHESIVDSELWELPGIGHDDWWTEPQFGSRVRGFIRNHSGAR